MENRRTGGFPSAESLSQPPSLKPLQQAIRQETVSGAAFHPLSPGRNLPRLKSLQQTIRRNNSLAGGFFFEPPPISGARPPRIFSTKDPRPGRSAPKPLLRCKNILGETPERAGGKAPNPYPLRASSSATAGAK